MQNLTILGATGSIGLSTLDVVARHPDKYSVFALTAHSKVAQLVELCRKHHPEYAVIANAALLDQLATALKSEKLDTKPLAGPDALCQVAGADSVDTVMAAIVGGAGLLPTLAAAKSGKRILLANKESLVMSGQIFVDAVRQSGAELLPIDSEHNAIYQCLPAKVKAASTSADLAAAGIEQILLTGSGGPFRTRELDSFSSITPDQACAHPNWSMGRKISVDSATMMNKGLEFIEAHWLFNAAPSQIEVVLHPQSVIHSMVRYSDGSVIAQLGQPDMRTPIAHALAFPQRIDAGVKPLDFADMVDFTFEKPCPSRYPCLSLAIEACKQGQEACTVLNAANEIAVDAFLNNRIRFTDISKINAQSLESGPSMRIRDLEGVTELDRMAREKATQLIRKL